MPEQAASLLGLVQEVAPQVIGEKRGVEVGRVKVLEQGFPGFGLQDGVEYRVKLVRVVAGREFGRAFTLDFCAIPNRLMFWRKKEINKVTFTENWGGWDQFKVEGSNR